MKKIWKVLCGVAVAAGCCVLAAKLFHSEKKKDADMEEDDLDVDTDAEENGEEA